MDVFYVKSDELRGKKHIVLASRPLNNQSYRICVLYGSLRRRDSGKKIADIVLHRKPHSIVNLEDRVVHSLLEERTDTNKPKEQIFYYSPELKRVFINSNENHTIRFSDILNAIQFVRKNYPEIQYTMRIDTGLIQDLSSLGNR